MTHQVTPQRDPADIEAPPPAPPSKRKAPRPDVSGGIGIFFSGGALAAVLVAALGLFGLLFLRGTQAFWPMPLTEWTMEDGSVFLVEERETLEDGSIRARIANREFQPGRLDFVATDPTKIVGRERPEDAVRIHRLENGPFHGYVLGEGQDEAGEAVLRVARPNGDEVELPQAAVLRIEHPNRMSWFGRLGTWFANLGRFIIEPPREANTEGGVLSPLVGTALMVFLMTLMVMPFGVLAAVYLNEYARDTWFTRVARVSVNNLAGVPSIVYGVFGLGFLIYGLGDSIDHHLLGVEQGGAAIFGQPGLLWAAVTMALLTVPVVVVATEEGLRSVPREQRDGALALGATRWEMLRKVILPGAKPGILTGAILAISRAAGEVAPLMLTGVVPFEPELPIDLEPPFLHLEERFMHLGFHIYAVGYQSPNVEASIPLVYATASLLLALVIALNLVAIRWRTKVRRSLQGR